MKGIVRCRKKRKFDGQTYYYYDMASRKKTTISRDDLWELAKTLPVAVKKTLLKIDKFKVPMTQQEQHDVLLLCSVSIYCFKGGPNMDIRGVSMEDYANDFYIEMVKLLKKWEPERGPWANYVKYVRLHTLRTTFRRWEHIKKYAEAFSHRAMDFDRTESVDWGSLQKLGTQISEGNRVCTPQPEY